MLRKLIRVSSVLAVVFVLAAVFIFIHQIRPLALAKSTEIIVDVKLIPHFQVGVDDRDRFGALRYVGGIEYSSPNEALGGISGIRVLEGGQRFLAVSDKGGWFTGHISRGEAGNITGIQNAKIAPLRNKKGKIITSKKKGDAEGIEIVGDQVFVSFERKHRVRNYQLDLDNLDATARSFRSSMKNIGLPNNKGLEAITVLEVRDVNRPLKARMAIFSENSLDDSENIRGFVSKKRKWKEFAVRKIGEFKITDATLVPSGDILILERQFSISSGPRVRIRRLDASKIVPGALVDGEILFEAGLDFEIDNLEGMSAWVNDQGQTILTIVSDNNFSFLQRSLMLEFELMPNTN